jgi:hypothetical protein
MLRLNYDGVLSKKELMYEILRSHLKSTLYRIFAIFNLQQALSSKRNIKLTASQITEVHTAINRIKNWK